MTFGPGSISPGGADVVWTGRGWRRWAVVTSGAAFTVAAVMIALSAGDPVGVVIGVACAVFFGASTVATLALSRRGVWKVTADGIDVFSPPLHIAWSEVRSVRLVQRTGSAAEITIDVNETEALLTTVPQRTAARMRKRIASGSGIVSIPTLTNPDALEVLRERLESARASGPSGASAGVPRSVASGVTAPSRNVATGLVALNAGQFVLALPRVDSAAEAALYIAFAVVMTTAALLVHRRRRVGVVLAVVAMVAQIAVVLALGSSELPVRLGRCAFTVVCIIGIVLMAPSPQRPAMPPSPSPPTHPPLQI